MFRYLSRSQGPPNAGATIHKPYEQWHTAPLIVGFFYCFSPNFVQENCAKRNYHIWQFLCKEKWRAGNLYGYQTRWPQISILYHDLIDKKKGPYTELDFFVLKMIKLNTYSVVCNTYNRVKKQMIHKIKNPHSTRRRWTDEEIRYLTNEFPHIETMGIAMKLNRNYDAVRKKAQRLGLKRTTFTRKKILKKNAPNPHE